MIILLSSLVNKTLKLLIAYRMYPVFSMKGNSNRLSELCRDESQFGLARKDDFGSRDNQVDDIDGRDVSRLLKVGSNVERN
ncbi:MAG: hypothetical protein A3D92_01100 [Bacteroidetes bacterium RIFCSPHIGHO2_02_FULL_44_7]|nr:MAG: hypothetical protein A3D92_01100 [Bacteroidetes bacterium RIFCSPHIGHO2_02_FULL_44_7]